MPLSFYYNRHMKTKNIFRVVALTAVALLILLFLRLFSESMVWDAVDFLVAGVLLLGAGFAYELIAARVENKRKRTFFVLALLTLFALVWADLAVGIFNIPGFSGN